jgi:TetR/AcrR family transcriptional regulator, tetracycline repressor protein
MSENEPLTRERFVAAAWDLIEERGFDALTMRSLGAAIGVSASAVYTYFSVREQLVAALADELLGRIRPADRSLPARERLAVQAENARELLRRHPDIGQVVAMSPGDSTTGTAVSRQLVADLEELGLHGDALVLAYRLYEGYVAGMSLFDFAGAPEHLEQRRLRYRALSHPAFDKHSRSADEIDALNERTFTVGLAALLDHIESLAGR